MDVGDTAGLETCATLGQHTLKTHPSRLQAVCELQSCREMNIHLQQSINTLYETRLPV
jgi:hypothetical protein